MVGASPTVVVDSCSPAAVEGASPSGLTTAEPERNRVSCISDPAPTRALRIDRISPVVLETLRSPTPNALSEAPCNRRQVFAIQDYRCCEHVRQAEQDGPLLLRLCAAVGSPARMVNGPRASVRHGKTRSWQGRGGFVGRSLEVAAGDTRWERRVTLVALSAAAAARSSQTNPYSRLQQLHGATRLARDAKLMQALRAGGEDGGVSIIAHRSFPRELHY